MTETSNDQIIDQQSKKFCFLFLFSFFGAFGTIFLTNYIVNPYGYYATTFFRPLVQTARNDKVYLLSQLDDKPEGVVIGSSRVMRMEPDYLKSFFGHDFFNFGVNSAMPEDYLAILRFYEKCCGQPPKKVILGIDIYSFTDALPMDYRLANCPELFDNLLELQERSLKKWKTQFSRQRKLLKENLKFYMFKDSLRSLKLEFWDGGKDEAKYEFISNGMMVDRLTRKQNADETFDLVKEIQFHKSDYARRYRGFEFLSENRCDYFETFLKICNDKNIHLLVFLTPLHPDLISDLEEKTTFTQRRDDVIAYISQECAKNQIRFYDFSKIDSFQGVADDFHDGVHATIMNNRRIINCMLPRMANKKHNAF